MWVAMEIAVAISVHLFIMFTQACCSSYSIAR